MKGISVIFLLMLVILSLAVSSCQSKAEKPLDVPVSDVMPKE